jgi:hypothetical protein
MIAAVRADSWNLPLFLHVFGAMAAFGTLFGVVVLAAAAMRRPERATLARNAWRALLLGFVPAWILMRVAAEWIRSKEDLGEENDPGWLGVGYVVTDIGLLVILLTLGFAFWWTRRRGEGWQGRVVLGLGSLYLVALAVAWWAMSAKPGA